MNNLGLENISQAYNTVSLSSFVVSIIFSFVLSYILSRFYKLQSNSLSNPESLARIFPVLSITTTIVIAVVKSSLALSLGLVGALSIVRFRTPIKEPEELTYIFLCIAIGLATGANQISAACIGLLLTMLFTYASKFLNNKKTSKKLIRINISGLETSNLDQVIEIISKNSERVDFNNMSINSLNDKNQTSLTLSFLPKNFSDIKNIANDISNKFSLATLNIIDSNY